MIVVLCAFSLLFFCTTLGFAVRSFERGAIIDEMEWAVMDLQLEADIHAVESDEWERFAAGANIHKKRWRRRARHAQRIIEHLERERHELNNQLHWMAIAYERVTDAIFKGQPQGRVLVTDLSNKKKAPVAFARSAS